MAKPQLRPSYRPVPKLLSALRTAAGLTQRQLAERLRVPQNTIHRMEVGSRRCDVVELIEWARACEHDPEAAFRSLAKRSGK